MDAENVTGQVSTLKIVLGLKTFKGLHPGLTFAIPFAVFTVLLAMLMTTVYYVERPVSSPPSAKDMELANKQSKKKKGKKGKGQDAAVVDNFEFAPAEKVQEGTLRLDEKPAEGGAAEGEAQSEAKDAK
ncbi:unnamed protein product, partial [Mesorhabditis spiculigera]